MPVPSEFANLIDVLEGGTKAMRSLVWRQTEHHGQYEARAPEYAVVLTTNSFTELFTSPGAAVQSAITVRALLPQGFTVGSFNVQPGEASYPRWRELYDLVRRHAMTREQAAVQLIQQFSDAIGTRPMSKVG